MKAVTKLTTVLLFFVAGQNLHAQCNNAPVVITGNTCQGAVLKATINSAVSSITWNLNGTAVTSAQSVSLSNSGVIVAGGNGSGTGLNQLSSPVRIFIDASSNLYIPDMGNNRIVKWAPGATAGVIVAGGNGAGSAQNQLDRPTSVFMDTKGNLYITDQNNNRVQKWTPGATSGITVARNLSTPTCVFVDGNENVYVSEQNLPAVTKFSPGVTMNGVFVAGSYSYGSAAHQLSTPTGIFVDASGNVYVCDTDNNRVQKWAPGATTGITVAGNGSFGSGANQLANPTSVYVDPSGNIYVADYNNYRVQKWEPGATSGITIAGGSNQSIRPYAIAFNKECDLYISEYNAHRVQKLATTASNTYTTLSAGDYTATVITATGQSFTSNRITVASLKTPRIRISTDQTNICPGVQVVFSTIGTDVGDDPVYQWKKNGVNIGSNLPVLTGQSIVDGDKISCELTTTGTCYAATAAASNTITMTVQKPSLPVSLGPDKTICPGTEVIFKAGTGYASYLWHDASTSAEFAVRSDGKYFVQVKDICGFTSSDTAFVFFYPKPVSFLPSSVSFCSGGLAELKSSLDFRQYVWSNQAATPLIEVRAPGMYWLQVVDENNCIQRDTVVVSQKECGKRFYVPNSFTPNGDGWNETFRPVLYDHTRQYRFSIYDRWGHLVFATSEPGKGWDGRRNGKTQDPNVFLWTCTYQFAGEPVHFEKGTVVLLK